MNKLKTMRIYFYLLCIFIIDFITVSSTIGCLARKRVHLSDEPPCHKNRTKNSQRRDAETSMAPTKYIWGRRICDFKNITYCNEHFESHMCLCYVPADRINVAAKSSIPYCPEILRVDSLEYLIITIGIGFPVPEQFADETDSMFTEDLEFFANIHRNSTIIMRKGCRPDKKVYEFQFGVAKTYRNLEMGKRFLTQHDLENIYPSMFTSNLNFMQQNGLIIEYVQQSDTFRPLIGYPDWITGTNGTRPKTTIGRCNVSTTNPQYDCFFYELGAVFVSNIYISTIIVLGLTSGLAKFLQSTRSRRDSRADLTYETAQYEMCNTIVV